jgi:uncharacterized protein with von Willebrand factor type A (vWA) domain
MSGNNIVETNFLGLDISILKQMEETPQNIHQDRYDTTLYNELRQASGKVQELEGQGTDTFPALLQDLWATFYKADPTLQEAGKVSTQYQINRPFVERVLEDSTTKELRATTMLDELSAGVAAAQAGEKMVGEINNREELRKAMQEANKAQQEEDKGNTEGANQIMAQAQQKLQAAARDVRRAVRESIQSGKEKAEELQGTLAGWGLQPDDLKRIPIGDRLKLAEKLTGKSDLKRIADLVGKMRNLARAEQKQKIRKQRDEIHSITIGGDINHILPAELSTLRHPTLRLDFFRKFTEKQLLQYDLKHQERQGRGPIVAAIDISDSMAGNNLEWAIASTLALADTASRQKRHCSILFFNAEVKQEFTFAPGERNIEKYIQMATIGASGGTRYEPALEHAQKTIDDSKIYENADIIMITDGLCRLDDGFLQAFNNWKRAKKVNCYTILISNDFLDELKKWNNKVWQISNLTDTGNAIAGELFQEVY